jgi:hypothetical protein
MNIHLEFKIEEVNVLLTALGKAPYEISAGLISKIKSEVTKQINEQKSNTADLTPTTETRQ